MIDTHKQIRPASVLKKGSLPLNNYFFNNNTIFDSYKINMESRSNTVTATISQVPFTTKIVSGKHIIMADEPIDHGGADQGMTPYDLLLAALCSCTSITIKMYATRKGWMLSNVIVDATMERTVEGGNQITKVTQTLSFEGDLDDTMKNRLLEIGGRCPVHKTLAPAIQIESILKS